jgi:GH25 family lysozyme M1 (1,4-beta-N-acetylmuramidase)
MTMSMSSRERQSNEQYAKRFGFKRGLVALAPGNNGAGLRPSGSEFYEWVRGFQADHGLTVDGIMGPRSFRRWKEVYCTLDTEVRGVDVSGWQEEIDWEKVAEAGYTFAIVKGATGTGPGLARRAKLHAEGVLGAGMDLGYYFWTTPLRNGKRRVDLDQDAGEEVEAWLDMMDDLPLATLVPSIDVEENETPDGKDIPPAELGRFLGLLVKGVSERIGRPCILYSYSSFLRHDISDHDLGSKAWLWIAHYTNGYAPRMPREWSRYEIWQHTSSAHTKGIQGNHDANRAPYGIDHLRMGGPCA